MENNNPLIEQVVKREKGAKYGISIALILLGVIAIPALLIALSSITGVLYLTVVAFFVLLFCIYGAWYFITSLKVEYEYAFLSSVLRVDKVIANRRRRNILKFDVKQADDIFPFTDEEMSKRRFKKVYTAAAREFSEENYVLSFKSETKGRCALVFTPNEEFLNGIAPYCTSEIRKKILLKQK